MHANLTLLFPDFKAHAVTLSFDDGRDHDRKMVEILNRYGIKCTFNLNSGIIAGRAYRVQFEEFEDLYKSHEIAAHTYTHPHLNMLDLGGIAWEVTKDREALEAVVRRPVQGFAYPFGLEETPGMVDCIQRCGIRYARTVHPTHAFGLPTDFMRWNPTCHQSDPELPALAEKFFRPVDWEQPWAIRPRLFYIWGHSYEYEDKWESLEQLCRLVGGRETVWYATNGEIIDYITAFQALHRSADGKYIYNPTDKDIYIFANNKKQILKSGQLTVLE